MILKLMMGIMVLLIVLPAAAGEQQMPSKNKTTQVTELFFFQHADSGKITQANKPNNCYEILLSQPNKKIIYFSRAPQQITGKTSMKKFMLIWQHNSQSPNAILHANLINTRQRPQEISDVVLLKNPVYNKQANTVRYLACSLNKNNKLLTGKLTDINFFIDPFHPWPP